MFKTTFHSSPPHPFQARSLVFSFMNICYCGNVYAYSNEWRWWQHNNNNKNGVCPAFSKTKVGSARKCNEHAVVEHAHMHAWHRMKIGVEVKTCCATTFVVSICAVHEVQTFRARSAHFHTSLRIKCLRWPYELLKLFCAHTHTHLVWWFFLWVHSAPCRICGCFIYRVDKFGLVKSLVAIFRVVEQKVGAHESKSERDLGRRCVVS